MRRGGRLLDIDDMQAAKALLLLRQGKTPEFRFRMVLAVLLASIVSVVVLTWHLHEAFQEAMRLSTKSDFVSQTRQLRLLDRGGRTLLTGDLGQVGFFNSTLAYYGLV